jgi:hypothetical protein
MRSLARLFSLSRRAADGGIEAVLSAPVSRGGRDDPAFESGAVGMNDRAKSEPARGGIAKDGHFAELPGRLVVSRRERQRRRIKRLNRKVEQDA